MANKQTSFQGELSPRTDTMATVLEQAGIGGGKPNGVAGGASVKRSGALAASADDAIRGKRLEGGPNQGDLNDCTGSKLPKGAFGGGKQSGMTPESRRTRAAAAGVRVASSSGSKK